MLAFDPCNTFENGEETSDRRQSTQQTINSSIHKGKNCSDDLADLQVSFPSAADSIGGSARSSDTSDEVIVPIKFLAS